MRIRFLVAGCVVALGACFDEPTPPRGIQIGGTEYNMNLSLPASVRLPSSTSALFSRVVGTSTIIDSLIITAANLKELEAPAQYQYWIVNATTKAAWPITHSLRLTRTDSAFVNGALSTSTTVTNRGPSAFFPGAKFNNAIRFKVANGAGADTIGLTGHFLVLTIQQDTAAPAYTATTPKILWHRIRNPVTNAAIPNPPATFGSLRNISDSSRYVAQGFGRSAFWDRDRDGILHLSALVIGLPQPPVGYYYQPYARDSRTGAASRFGALTEKNTDSSLANADLAPAQGTLVQLPDARFRVRDDSLICTYGECASSRFTAFSEVQLVLEPKLADMDYPNATVTLQGPIPTLLTKRRAADGIVSVTVTRASAPSFLATVALYGAGTGSLIQTRTTNAQGKAVFTAVPSGPVDVRVFPPVGVTSSAVTQRITVTAGSDTTQVAVTLP